jgi:hypothetical protein
MGSWANGKQRHTVASSAGWGGGPQRSPREGRDYLSYALTLTGRQLFSGGQDIIIDG